MSKFGGSSKTQLFSAFILNGCP